MGAIGGGGVPLGLLLPKGELPTEESESKEDSSHMWRPTISACPLRIRVVGRIWYCPETCGTFQNLPGPAGTILGHSGTFRDGFGTFQNLLEHFQDLTGPF